MASRTVIHINIIICGGPGACLQLTSRPQTHSETVAALLSHGNLCCLHSEANADVPLAPVCFTPRHAVRSVHNDASILMRMKMS